VQCAGLAGALIEHARCPLLAVVLAENYKKTKKRCNL